jgi:hypothetical protein
MNVSLDQIEVILLMETLLANPAKSLLYANQSKFYCWWEISNFRPHLPTTNALQPRTPNTTKQQTQIDQSA